MYAIIAESGRQFRVEEGQELQIDYREVKAGDTIAFDEVLAVSGDGETRIGTPKVEGAKVEAVVVGTSQGPKLVVQKFRRRKNSRRRTGHRQVYTTVRITGITG
ncbi:MAG: 50S ribosomal protein L21 [Planctomycetales bacterium]|nr:50S ribosomal protein L21 [Planctomycetales bacterium]